MAETQTNITDSQLLAGLKNSLIDESQKKELIPLIPKMTAEERIQLMGLIEESTEEIGKARKEHDEGINAVNKEFNSEVKRIDQEYAKKTTKKLEEIDSKKVTGELAQMETEILETAKTKKELTARQKLGNAKKHGLRNAILFFLFLIALASAIVYALNYL